MFPPTYLVIGRMTSGGTTSPRALLIGVDMYGLTPGAPMDGLSDWHRTVLKSAEAVPHIVAHELIHYQQRYPENQSVTLLSQSDQGRER